MESLTRLRHQLRNSSLLPQWPAVLSPYAVEDDNIERQASINPTALRVTDSYYNLEALRCSESEPKEHHQPLLPKILILFCGGTLIMRENEDGSLVVNDKNVAIQLLLSMEPKLNEMVQLDVHYLDNIDSSNMSPVLWNAMGDVIHRHYDDYDGFVITHGTDTMAYTASALSFVLQDLGKPVVLTGAQIPASRMETDARRNFVNAIRVATLDRAGVMLVFDGDILMGARSHKLSESKLDAFGPINDWGILGEIRIDIRFREDTPRRHNRPLQLQTGFTNAIAVYTIFPGFPSAELKACIYRGDIQGIVLNAYGSGNLSYQYLDAIQLAKDKDIAVVVTTQCLEGATLMHLYDVGRQALNCGAIQAYDMSLECVITKFMWALKRGHTLDEIRTIMHTNYTGEINVEGKLYASKT